MKQKLVALAAMAVATPAVLAQTSVQVYGLLDAGVSQVTGLAGGTRTFLASGIMEGSRLGFKGNEDLGGGYRAIFTMEHRLEVDTADLFQRATPLWNVPIYPSDVVNVPVKTAVKVFCLGELKNPGALEFDPSDRITLLAAIAKAGGLTDRASRGSIRIKRHGENGQDVELKADYKRIVRGKDRDVVLQADDVIVVKESLF